MHFKFISLSIYVNVNCKSIFMFSSCCIGYLVSLTFSIYTSLFIVQYHSFMFRFYVFNLSCRWILLMLSSYFLLLYSSYFNLYFNLWFHLYFNYASNIVESMLSIYSWTCFQFIFEFMLCTYLNLCFAFVLCTFNLYLDKLFVFDCT